MKRTLLKQLPFDIAARLPIQLGRENIASSTAAIAELIKNSYDADAENVEISFLGLNNPVAVLQIADDGNGMDEIELEKFWLNIGTENKTGYEFSRKKRRVLTGAKGLGRLGIDRLCKRLILQTKKPGMDSVLELHVKWSKYYDDGATISNVLHDIYSVECPVFDKYGEFFSVDKGGTRMLLVGLKDSWGENELEVLKRDISLLVTPFSKTNDFSIVLRSGFPKLDGVLSSERALDHAVWSVSAEITEDNLVRCSYRYKDHDQPIEVTEHKWKDWLPDREELPACGALKFDFYYLPQPEEGAVDFSKGGWRDFMDANQGIRIYRDSFRVRPYGEPNGRGDWLDLGLRKAKSPGGIKQGGWRIGPHQIVGAVFISRIHNANLVDQSNREGLIESSAYGDLRFFALKVIKTFESVAHNFSKINEPLVEEAEDALRKFEQSINDSQTAVAKLKEELNNAPELPKINHTLDEVERLFEEAKTASERHESLYKEKQAELERQKDTLANLASLGILTVCFGHEAKEFCNLASGYAGELKINFKDGVFMIAPDLEEQFINDIDTIIESTDFIRNFSSFALGNVRRDKRTRRKINIGEVIFKVFDVLSPSLRRQNIECDLSGVVVGGAEIMGFEIDWESIIVNLISNSVWALEGRPVGSRVIKVELSGDSEFLNLCFSDSGIGIEAGTEKHIFNAMFSTRRDSSGNMSGTGMGLSIVNTFVADHGKGSITVLPKGAAGGAEFKIRMPRK